MRRTEKEGMLYNLFYEAIIALMPEHYKQEKFQVSTSEELKSKSPEQKVGRLHPIYLKKESTSRTGRAEYRNTRLTRLF